MLTELSTTNGFGAATAPLKARVRRAHEIDARFIAAWQRLDERSLEPNPYLSPHFICPALRMLGGQQKMLIISIEREVQGVLEIVCLAVFEAVLAGRRMPLPHLRAYQSQHSFLVGFLVDRREAQGGIEEFVAFIRSSAYVHCGLEFFNQLPKGRVHQLFTSACAAAGGTWCEYGTSSRAMLMKARSGTDYLDALLSARRKKAIRRAYRQLASEGPVKWRIARGREARAAAESFLWLEHKGWKGSSCSSLRSNPRAENFFREAVNGFARHHRVFFTELLVGGRPVASSAYFTAGSGAFGFKIGWDPNFAGSSPGFLNELEFVRRFPEECPDLDWVDSCARDGSFIESLWTARRPLTCGFFAANRLGSAAAHAMSHLRRIKALLTGAEQLPSVEPLPAYE